MPHPNDFEWQRGEQLTFNFTMTPVEDITNGTFVLYLKAHETDSDALIEQAGSVVNGPSGTFRFIVPSSKTTRVQASLPGKDYYLTVWRTDVDACVSKGRAKVGEGLRGRPPLP